MTDQPGQYVSSSLLHSEGSTAVSLQQELDWPLDSCFHLTSPPPLPSGTHHCVGQTQVVGGHHLPAGRLGHNGHLGDIFHPGLTLLSPPPGLPGVCQPGAALQSPPSLGVVGTSLPPNGQIPP